MEMGAKSVYPPTGDKTFFHQNIDIALDYDIIINYTVSMTHEQHRKG